MKLTILSEGREKADPASSMVTDYIARVQKFISVEDTVLRPGAKIGLLDKVHQAQKNGALIVAMDERGRQYTSVAFSKRMEQWIGSGHQNIVFVIGGAEGLPKEIKAMAQSTIALSQMTLPHRFARLILFEQLYRAMCISKNIPYHK